jgi:hypothetical protein
VNGLVVSLDEGKERNLGDSLAKLKHSFKDSAEHWGEKLYILNSQTGHSFNFDLAVILCYISLAILALSS